MVVFSFIIMVVFVLDKGLEMYIGGIVIFDVLVLYFLGFWSGQLNIIVDLISMSIFSRFDIGNIVWTVKELIVGGIFNFQFIEEVKVIIFRVKGIGVVIFIININLKSVNFNIEVGGVLDLDFR